MLASACVAIFMCTREHARMVCCWCIDSWSRRLRCRYTGLNGLCRLESNRQSARRTRAKQGEFLGAQAEHITQLHDDLTAQHRSLEASIKDVATLRTTVSHLQSCLGGLQMQVCACPL